MYRLAGLVSNNARWSNGVDCSVNTLIAMENIARYISGIIGAVAAYFAPVRTLVTIALVFVAIDFITGCWASRERSKRRQEPWAFSSLKAWRTVYKAVFIMCGIILAWMLDGVLEEVVNLRLALLFTGFVCGIEMWSYLENAAEISDHPIFRWVRNFTIHKLEDAGIDIEKYADEGKSQTKQIQHEEYTENAERIKE